MLNLVVASINISPLSGAGTIFGQGKGAKNITYVSFYPKVVKHQRKIFNGSRVFAHSLIIKSKRGSGVRDLAFGDFGIYYHF